MARLSGSTLDHPGAGGHIEYVAGDLPLVLAVPHGGSLRPADMPDAAGHAVGDRNTISLAWAVADAARKLTGGTPHIIICNVKRSRLDVNREDRDHRDDAAGKAWRAYHGFIEAAAKAVTLTFGSGCYVELHGHAHPIQRLELGYLLGPRSLGLSDDAVAARRDRSSLRALAQATSSTFPELIRGRESFGGLMQAAGFPSVPSPRFQGPGSDPFFGGGYGVKRHGSRDGGTVSGLQIECNYLGVRDTAENRERFAHAFMSSMDRFFAIHFGQELKPRARS